MTTKTIPQPKVKNALIDALRSKDTVTGNMAVSHSTTGNGLVDFFGKSGSMRSHSEDDVKSLFSAAYNENKLLAIKILFYLSDVRGGQGERKLFRTCFNWLAQNDSEIAKKLIKYVPFYTRWDNILESLENTPLENDALKFVSEQLKKDLDNDNPSILSKWLPSEQASSERTRRLAWKMIKLLKWSPKKYRKTLSNLRKQIDVVERKMCANKWSSIDYEEVPSLASSLYRKAFSRHDKERYDEFLRQVEKGEKKINASVLYPYDIIRNARNTNFESDKTLNEQWKRLSNYLTQPHNGLAIIDTSGSMTSNGYYGGKNNNVAPIDVAISLAIYFAERNIGAFKNYFTIFSETAQLLQLTGNSVQEKAKNIYNLAEVANTNLQAVFDLILNRAKEYKVSEKEMPSVLYIVSDMQFDEAVEDNSMTNFETIQNKYKNAGYKLPRIVFWNVNSYSDIPIKITDNGICLVSGCSPSILKSVLSGKIMTPWDAMINTINVDRYNQIKI